jgi:hypothetical protein
MLRLSLILGTIAALADVAGGLVLVRARASSATCATSWPWGPAF